MTPYLDAGFLLNLLVPADGSAVAHRILRRGSAPFALMKASVPGFDNLVDRGTELDREPVLSRTVPD